MGHLHIGKALHPLDLFGTIEVSVGRPGDREEGFGMAAAGGRSFTGGVQAVPPVLPV